MSSEGADLAGDPNHAPTRRSTLAWPLAPVGFPLFYLWLAWSWWVEARTQLEALDGMEGTLDPGAMGAAAVAGRIPAVLAEAAVYRLWWRAQGLRLPFWRFTSWVALLSGLDLLGFSLRRAVENAPEPVRIAVALLAGPGPGGAPGAHAGLTAAFGSFGLFTVARVVMTAWAQARGLGGSLAGPLLVTSVAWLLTRLIAWWSVDLMRGLSPVP